MAAQNAEAIYAEFRSLRDRSNGQTPEHRLTSYCQDVLTSVERLPFDYKTKTDTRTPALDDSDKRNLAKAISGFANSGGGVLLWGIKGEEDKPLQFKPIG